MPARDVEDEIKETYFVTDKISEINIPSIDGLATENFVTDEIKKEAKEYLAEVKKSISDANWKAFLETMGYENDQQYIDERVILSVQANELTTTYINENYDQLKEDFQIRKVQIFQTFLPVFLLFSLCFLLFLHYLKNFVRLDNL